MHDMASAVVPHLLRVRVEVSCRVQALHNPGCWAAVVEDGANQPLDPCEQSHAHLQANRQAQLVVLNEPLMCRPAQQ